MSKSKEFDLQSIFWDFDGVILNSNAVRDLGFERVLASYPLHEVEALLEFHQKNGGLSRYVKFSYFFEKIRNEEVTEETIKMYANQFSEIMKVLLTDKSLLINETVTFIKKHYQELPMIIVSGSDQTELRYLCNALGIDHCFKRIHGSPKPKIQWVKEILEEERLDSQRCLLIGDSLNDFEAASENALFFMGYNNPMLEDYTTLKIQLT